MEVELKELRAKMETMQADHAQAEAAAKAKLGKFKAALEEREADVVEVRFVTHARWKRPFPPSSPIRLFRMTRGFLGMRTNHLQIDEQLRTALSSVSLFEEQQQQLFDEFVLLRSKYDALKSSTLEILWDAIPNCEGSAFTAVRKSIPPVEKNCIETKSRIGPFELLEALGDGQFATVRACREFTEGESPETSALAAKVIAKEKVRALSIIFLFSSVTMLSVCANFLCPFLYRHVHR